MYTEINIFIYIYIFKIFIIYILLIFKIFGYILISNLEKRIIVINY